ncbi:MAG: ubiquitin-conjugating enzyme E2 [archaeon]|nr:ubiquitin-conjugating enzyme E2 [archaeon]
MSSSSSELPTFVNTAGPLDAGWEARLKEEYAALIAYIKRSKDTQTDWFRLKADDAKGLKWSGTCWTFQRHKKHLFEFSIELPSSYPNAPPDIFVPFFENKTPKMYRGGRICLDIHFQPLWIKKSPAFGLVHALAMGLAPWIAAEIPIAFPEVLHQS